MAEKIDHIGIAVSDLQEAAATFSRLLGVPASEPEEVTEQKVRVIFFDVGGVHIELLEPTCPESTVAGFIEKRGPGLHHLAFAVDGIENELQRLTGEGIRLIDQTPRKGAHGMKIAFVHPKSSAGVLTELCEKTDCHE